METLTCIDCSLLTVCDTNLIIPLITKIIKSNYLPSLLSGYRGGPGQRGQAGTSGAQGGTGRPGLRGNGGRPGPPGTRGESGAQGPQGPIGGRGNRGQRGPPGSAGTIGLTGKYVTDNGLNKVEEPDEKKELDEKKYVRNKRCFSINDILNLFILGISFISMQNHVLFE